MTQSKEVKLEKTLNEVVVTAPMKVIDIKGDTTIINAEAFKVREGVNLEELVRGIPGLVYNKIKGTLHYNGLQLHEINVNGQSYFPGKTDLALENLPAELFSKIKIYEKQTELEKFTGVKTGSGNYVLDLQTKNKFDGVLMVDARVSAGNYDKKEASVYVNRFRKKEAITFDINSGNKNLTSPYKDNRKDGGRFSYSRHSDKLTLSGYAYYDYNHASSKTMGYSENYLINNNRYSNYVGGGLNSYYNLNGGINANWFPRMGDMLQLTVRMNANKSRSNSERHEATFTEFVGLPLLDPFNSADFNLIPNSSRLNEQQSVSQSNSGSMSYTVDMSYSHKIADKTTLSIETQYDPGNSYNDNYSVSSVRYYKLLNFLGNDSVLYRNQYSDNDYRHNIMSVSTRLSHYFNDKFTMAFEYKFSSRKHTEERSTYDLSPFESEYGDRLFDGLPEGYGEFYVDSLSNNSSLKIDTHSFSLTFNGTFGKFSTNARVAVEPLRRTLFQKTGLNKDNIVRNSVDYRAGLSVNYRRDKSTASLSYTFSTQQPDLRSLTRLVDNSNPMNIICGNPDLKAAYMQSFRLSINNTNTGLSGYLDFSQQYNSPASSVVYDMKTGSRTVSPVNINGNWGANASAMYYKNIKNRFDASITTRFGMSNNVSLINDGTSELPQRSNTLQRTAMLSLMSSYSPDWGGMTLNFDWIYGYSINRLRDTKSYNRDYTIKYVPYVELPCDITLRSPFTYNLRSGSYVSAGFKNRIEWNFSVAWRFLRRRRAELSVEWFDILNNNKSLSRYVTSTSLSESYTAKIKSYFIVSFRYKLNILNGEKKNHKNDNNEFAMPKMRNTL